MMKCNFPYNLEQSELSHIKWLEYIADHKDRAFTEADRMIWKAAFSYAFSEARKRCIYLCDS
jgi:hypothetical protein